MCIRDRTLALFLVLALKNEGLEAIPARSSFTQLDSYSSGRAGKSGNIGKFDGCHEKIGELQWHRKVWEKKVLVFRRTAANF